MVSVQLFCCTHCGRVDAHDSKDVVAKDRPCSVCLIGTMKTLIAQTGAMSGKFFRVD